MFEEGEDLLNNKRFSAVTKSYEIRFKEQEISMLVYCNCMYSLITHSTVIEGSTVTEIENQLLFDEGISAKGRSVIEQLMN